MHRQVVLSLGLLLASSACSSETPHIREDETTEKALKSDSISTRSEIDLYSNEIVKQVLALNEEIPSIQFGEYTLPEDATTLSATETVVADEVTQQVKFSTETPLQDYIELLQERHPMLNVVEEDAESFTTTLVDGNDPESTTTIVVKDETQARTDVRVSIYSTRPSSKLGGYEIIAPIKDDYLAPPGQVLHYGVGTNSESWKSPIASWIIGYKMNALDLRQQILDSLGDNAVATHLLFAERLAALGDQATTKPTLDGEEAIGVIGTLPSEYGYAITYSINTHKQEGVSFTGTADNLYHDSDLTYLNIHLTTLPLEAIER